MPAKKTVKIFDLQGKPVDKLVLPDVFETPIRPDVIKRAVLAVQSSRLQPQGRDPMAGKRTSAESRGTGMGIARVPRVKGGGGRAAVSLVSVPTASLCTAAAPASRGGCPAGAVNSARHSGQITRLPADFSAIPICLRHAGQLMMIAIVFSRCVLPRPQFISAPWREIK